MNIKHLVVLFATTLIGLPGLFAAEPVKGFETENLVLYQPDSVLRERIPNVEDFSSYIRHLQGVCEDFFSIAKTPETLHIVVALRPGKRSRVWFVSSTPSSGDMNRESLRLKLEAVTPIDVYHGPVAFAISAKIAGGKGNVPKVDGEYQPPIPREWQDAARNRKNPLVISDDLLELVWPDASSALAQDAAPVPAEFVTQVLEPTGGKILRPKDWFYSEEHHGSTYMWTLSREDVSRGQPYTTGVRIQIFVGIKGSTGKSAKEFILAFVASKNREAAKVLKTCAEKDQGLFTRICLETEEGPYHILYSLFWGTSNLDVAVVSIAGTTKGLWDTYSPTFDKMSAFELIDMKRFEQ